MYGIFEEAGTPLPLDDNLIDYGLLIVDDVHKHYQQQNQKQQQLVSEQLEETKNDTQGNK